MAHPPDVSLQPAPHGVPVPLFSHARSGGVCARVDGSPALPSIHPKYGNQKKSGTQKSKNWIKKTEKFFGHELGEVWEVWTKKGEVFYVSESDLEAVKKRTWHKNKDGYAQTMLQAPEKKPLMMHRMLLGLQVGEFGDHRDLDPSNNTRSNLRKCTKAQNQRNHQGYPLARRGKYKGLYYYKKTRRWCAQIEVGGKKIRRGYYLSEIFAAQKYDELAKEHHGEFARLNFPVSENPPTKAGG